ncbi:MBL fold metallo-hydrolase [Corynebacterium terpenotabidum]|uniref:Metallo-beta-lactamase domain-containing protein n=1 Tax=Corynebacterium terpenotabidum Y-11 TaxID=1200352 RepID=S4XE77_9CORY|nr:MBL fold metallo-hydrolase [Corynebacterium terpenotabidum]AGP30864.1 hypothetical protein A606_06085 [Corynebacterium terpenotabidum Y-11]
MNTVPSTPKTIVLPTGPLETNCLVIHDGARATVVDPGMGAAALVRQTVADQGLTVEQIVLTHGHIDHIRDLPELQQEYGVPVYMHHGDLPWLTRGALDAMGPLGELHRTAEMEVPAVPQPVEEGDVLTIAGVEFTAVHMPGHSPGSVMFRGAEGTVLGGDVLFRGGVGRTDLPLSDPHAMMASLRRIPEEFADSDVVYPGHGPATTIGEERRTNGFLQGIV